MSVELHRSKQAPISADIRFVGDRVRDLALQLAETADSVAETFDGVAETWEHVAPRSARGSAACHESARRAREMALGERREADRLRSRGAPQP